MAVVSFPGVFSSARAVRREDDHLFSMEGRTVVGQARGNALDRWTKGAGPKNGRQMARETTSTMATVATRKRMSWTQQALIAEIHSQDARRRPRLRGACEATHAVLNHVDPSELLAAFLLAEIVQNPLGERGMPRARRRKRPRHERLPELHEDLASQDSAHSATPRIATSHPTLDRSSLPALEHLAGHVPDVQRALGLHVSLMPFCTVACASFSHLL